MAVYQSKYIIVGAGLSGLTTARQLLKSGEDDFLILDSRAQIRVSIAQKGKMGRFPNRTPKMGIKNVWQTCGCQR